MTAKSEGAPVPVAAEARGEATDARVFWSLSLGTVNLDCSCAARALAVGTARAHLLPLAELAMAPIAGPLPVTLWVEESMLVEPHPLLRVLPTEDATALSAMVAAIEEAKRLLACGRGTNCRGTVRLNHCQH